jgi:hypothetical protein
MMETLVGAVCELGTGADEPGSEALRWHAEANITKEMRAILPKRAEKATTVFLLSLSATQLSAKPGRRGKP